MSLNLLIGYGGLLQVAHAAYYGIGAYAAALLWTKLGWGFFPGLAGGAFAAGGRGLFGSLPAWGVSGGCFGWCTAAGPGNGPAPLTGAAVLILFPEALRFLQLPDAVAANVRLLAYGLLLVIMMHLRPQGLAGTYRYQ